jgi:Na+/phosphate symporter
MKLPLSTTYVTFMVAMGTSLADRAWGRESAVYRVAGVLNVIGGWFFTAFSAFVAAGIVAFLIHWNVKVMIPVLLLLVVLLLVRSYLSYKKKSTSVVYPKSLKKYESSTVQGIILESADNISNVVSRTNKIYSDVLKGLAKEDIKNLKKSRKGVDKLDTEIEELRDNIFYFIKNLDETSVRGSSFYITILAYLTDMTQSLDFISKKSYKHINNNHKKLKFNQIKDLQEIDDSLEGLLIEIEEVFNSRKFERISYVLSKKQELITLISEKITTQIDRTRTEEESPKNTSLYFNILLETKDLVTSIMNLMDEYYTSYKKE